MFNSTSLYRFYIYFYTHTNSFGMEKCLNCELELEGRFCHKCGQDSTTKRFNWRYILVHDILNGFFDHRKGFYFTIYKLIKSPGNSIRDYVLGKRVKYMNYYGFFGLSILLFSIAESYTGFSYSKLNNSQDLSMSTLDEFLKNYPKLFYIINIPLNALFSYLCFYKSRINYWEHIILNSYRMSFMIIINTIFILSSLFIDLDTLFIIQRILVLFNIAYSTWFLTQFFKPFYKSYVGLFIRSILSIIIPTLVLSMLIILYVESILPLLNK